MERKEAVKKESARTIKIEESAMVQRTVVELKGSFAEDCKLELKAFMATMSYMEVDQTFKAFENSYLLNSYSS
jgi:hypothetical protein